MSQLELDLRHHIDNKMHLWLKDSMAVYEMADIKDRAPSAIAEVLLRCLCAGLAANSFTDDQAHELMRVGMKRARQARTRVIQRKAHGGG